MNITEILTDLGIEVDVAKKAEKAINKEIPLEFVAKDQYNKKITELDETRTALKDAQGSAADLDAYKEKIASLEEEYKTYKAKSEKDFADYKTSVETEKVTAAKSAALRKHLLDSGAVDDELILESLQSKFDLTKLELDDAKKFKGWDDTLKPVKEQYAKHFTVQEQQPAAPVLPSGVRVMQPDGIKSASGGAVDPTIQALAKGAGIDPTKLT